jgi:hypothetical protein
MTRVLKFARCMMEMRPQSNSASVYCVCRPLDNYTNMPPSLKSHLKKLIQDHWQYLDEGWPTREPATNHRTALKDVGNIAYVKQVLLTRLGAVPVFFFLVVIWPVTTYPGPYREVDKGLLILYHLVKGLSMDGMSPCIPKSSFHALHSAFYKRDHGPNAKKVTQLMETMFSTISIRLLSAQEKNPPLFKHVTLHLDGHDTRATYEGEASAEMYSYKLKKSGLRTQVCMDPNSMAIWVSKSQPCKRYQDGQMLVDMKMHNKMHDLDCLALDGGYTQYIKTLVEETDLSTSNFAYPIRKRRLQELTQEESNYNSIFGSFRSQMESLFGDLGHAFEIHNNSKPVLVEKRQTYNLQMRLCLLLLNVKRMVALVGLEADPIHLAWTKDGFDYPVGNKTLEQPMDETAVAQLLEDGDSMAKLQAAFLNMSTMEVDEQEPSTNKRALLVSVEIPINKRRF